jgi:hypothetical protein
MPPSPRRVEHRENLDDCEVQAPIPTNLIREVVYSDITIVTLQMPLVPDQHGSILACYLNSVPRKTLRQVWLLSNESPETF